MSTTTSADAKKGSAFTDQFRLLVRYPNFGLLWTGQTISFFGDAFYSIALIWLVQEMTGSRTMMGAISAVVSATALFGLVAGALVDRWDRRLTMLFSDILRGLVILTIPVLFTLGRMEIWHLFAAGLAMGLLSQLFNPAKQALLPHLVPPADLTGANALSQMSYTLLMAVGYGLGGALIGLMTTSQLFAIDSATFAVSAFTIWLMRVPTPVYQEVGEQETPEEQEKGGVRHLKDDILEGFRYIRSDALISITIPVALIANFVFAPLTVLLAAWAKDEINAGAQGFGLLMGSYLGGTLLGTLSASTLTGRFSRGRLVIWGVILMGLPLIILALLPNLYLDMMMLAFIGFTNGIVNIILIATFQQRVPDAMMGRFFGTFIGLSMLAAPLGIALGGVIADYVPLSTILIVMGVAMALIGVSLFRQPAVVELS